MITLQLKLFQLLLKVAVEVTDSDLQRVKWI